MARRRVRVRVRRDRAKGMVKARDEVSAQIVMMASPPEVSSAQR